MDAAAFASDSARRDTDVTTMLLELLEREMRRGCRSRRSSALFAIERHDTDGDGDDCG
jgi:hypothetical protein